MAKEQKILGADTKSAENKKEENKVYTKLLRNQVKNYLKN